MMKDENFNFFSDCRVSQLGTLCFPPEKGCEIKWQNFPISLSRLSTRSTARSMFLSVDKLAEVCIVTLIKLSHNLSQGAGRKAHQNRVWMSADWTASASATSSANGLLRWMRFRDWILIMHNFIFYYLRFSPIKVERLNERIFRYHK